MSIEPGQLFLYVVALFALVVSPGPVVAAVVARVVSRGFAAAWPIALAVMVGDFIWVSVALLGVGGLAAAYPAVMSGIRYLGAAYLAYLGWREIQSANEDIESADLAKTRSFWPNFTVGLVIILSNPKAILFYMLFVPSYFDLTTFGWRDILLIGIVTAIVPFVGNMIWAGAAHYASRIFSTVRGRTWLRRISGAALILVALFLLFY